MAIYERRKVVQTPLKFDRTFFINNRRRLLESAQCDMFILWAGGKLQKSADIAYPFRVNSNFWYLCGIEVPDTTLVLTATDCYAVLGQRFAGADMWEGALDDSLMLSLSGLTSLESYSEGWRRIKSDLSLVSAIGVVPPAPSYIKGMFYTNPGGATTLKKIRRLAPRIKTVDIRSQLAQLRSIKQPIEIATLQSAIDITGQTLQTVASEPVSHERPIAARLGYEYHLRGASGHAFDPIVAGGKNAATVHYMSNDQPIEANDMVLIDTGALMDRYGADLTRTLRPAGGFSSRQKQVYQAVLDVYERTVERIIPGKPWMQLEDEVLLLLAEQLAGLGLLNSKSDTAAARKYFPQLACHSLGIDLHDALERSATLQAGMVMAVEPSLYIPEEGIGIRLEDNVLITENGIRNLSSHWLPHAKLLN